MQNPHSMSRKTTYHSISYGVSPMGTVEVRIQGTITEPNGTTTHVNHPLVDIHRVDGHLILVHPGTERIMRVLHTGQEVLGWIKERTGLDLNDLPI